MIQVEVLSTNVLRKYTIQVDLENLFNSIKNSSLFFCKIAFFIKHKLSLLHYYLKANKVLILTKEKDIFRSKIIAIFSIAICIDLFLFMQF